ncbi:MAG: MoxR family ATPase [Chloroflexi bacterium]|nr:MoxR family ATPase [Chloroflexota bacterium]
MVVRLPHHPALQSVEALEAALNAHGYVPDPALSMALYLALRMEKPLLLEGEAGVGKTEVAKVLAAILDAELIRLQCYEGIDLASAGYEWNYLRQILALRVAEASGAARLDDVFQREFLIERPLLRAITAGDGRPAVLLIDEIDRADDEFEAFLLEVLSDFQISIPELGTVRAERVPAVILTSNRTREIHDALKRRCLYAWIDYPPFEKELRIVQTKVPAAGEKLAREVCQFLQLLRRQDLYKLPGISETLDWTHALVVLGQRELDEAIVTRTIGCLVKYQEDLRSLRPETLAGLVRQARE